MATIMRAVDGRGGQNKLDPMSIPIWDNDQGRSSVFYSFPLRRNWAQRTW
jgi:hypothetical protein